MMRSSAQRRRRAMKKSPPPPHTDATTQIILGSGDDADDVILEANEVDLAPAPVRMTAPPPLPPMAAFSQPPASPASHAPASHAPASHAPSAFPEPPPAKPRYWIYALILLAFFGVSVAGAALLLRATAKKVPAAAAKASAAPSTQPTVITISPVDMTGPESTP